MAGQSSKYLPKVSIEYADVNGKTSTRKVRPLGLACWGQTWTLGAWCEMREGYRDFRIDRIAKLQVLEELIPEGTGIDLEGYVRNRQECED